MASSAVVAQQKQTNGKRATEIHGCAYLVSDSLRSPAQSVFRVPGLPPVCFCPVHLCRAPFFFTCNQLSCGAFPFEKNTDVHGLTRMRHRYWERNHRCTRINTDEAQIKKNKKYLCLSVCICVKNIGVPSESISVCLCQKTRLRNIKRVLKKMASSRETAYRNRRLACYTRFVLVIMYVCRLRGSTNRVFS